MILWRDHLHMSTCGLQVEKLFPTTVCLKLNVNIVAGGSWDLSAMTLFGMPKHPHWPFQRHHWNSINIQRVLVSQKAIKSVILTSHTFIFVLRKKGSKTKERMKEEEIEKGDCGPPTRKVFFWFCRTWTKRYLITSQTRVKRVSRIHHRTILMMVRWCICEDGPVVYPANAFDSRLRGD